MNCLYCCGQIDTDRREFLLESNRPLICLDCSTEKKHIGYMDYAHKTAPQLVMCSANATETKRILDRANRRAR
jgi:hypothetical protein